MIFIANDLSTLLCPFLFGKEVKPFFPDDKCKTFLMDNTDKVPNLE